MTIAEIIAMILLIVAILGMLGGIGVLIFKSGSIVSGIGDIKKDVKILPVLKFQVDDLWEHRIAEKKSPMQLNPEGEKILEQSGIKEIIEKYYDKIVQDVKKRTPENAFQGQECIIKAVNDLKNNEDCIGLLEKGAFDSGTGVDTILLVGAIDIRDKILEQLGLKSEDIDKNQHQ